MGGKSWKELPESGKVQGPDARERTRVPGVGPANEWRALPRPDYYSEQHQETGEQGSVIMKASRKGVDCVLSSRVNLLCGKMGPGPGGDTLDSLLKRGFPIRLGTEGLMISPPTLLH